VSAHSCALRQPVNSVTHASTTPRHVCVHNTVHIWRTRRIPADPHANADTFISDDADAHALALMHAPLDAHKVRSRRVRTAHAQAPTCPTHRTSHPTNQSNYARVRDAVTITNTISRGAINTCTHAHAHTHVWHVLSCTPAASTLHGTDAHADTAYTSQHNTSQHRALHTRTHLRSATQVRHGSTAGGCVRNTTQGNADQPYALDVRTHARTHALTSPTG
jgi:hypothetical protein